MAEVLTRIDQLLALLRRESATTTPALDKCLLTSAAVNLLQSLWKTFDVSEGKEANSGDECDWRKGYGGHG